MKTHCKLGVILFIFLLNFSCSNNDEADTPEIIVPNDEQEYFDEGINFDTQAHEKNITFTTNTDWTIDIAETRSNVSWCTVFPKSGKAGKNSIQIKTEENDTYDDRSVVITLNVGNVKKTIMITQKQRDALIVTSKRVEIDAEGGDFEVKVKSNIDYDVVIPDEFKQWISFAGKSRTLSTAELEFEVAKSEEVEKREGAVIIKGGMFSETVQVFQTGQKILLLTEDECDVPAEGGTITAEIKSNFDYEVKMPDVDWITENTGSRSVSSHTLYYMVSPNTSGESREADIVFYDRDSDLSNTLHIDQNAKSVFQVSQHSFTVNSEGENISFSVHTNLDYEVQTDVDWIIQNSTRGFEDKTLLFTVQPNKTSEKRIGTITVGNAEENLMESITVTQNAKGKLTVSQKSFQVGVEGGNIQVKATSNVELSVRVDGSWLHQVATSKSRATEQKTFAFQVDRNDTYDPRRATIEIYNEKEKLSEIISVNQSSMDGLFISQDQFKVQAAGGTISVKINSNVGYTIQSNNDWIKKNQSRGLSEDTILFSIDANVTSKQRTGSITVTSGGDAYTITVIQDGKSGDGDFDGEGEDMPWS